MNRGLILTVAASAIAAIAVACSSSSTSTNGGTSGGDGGGGGGGDGGGGGGGNTCKIADGTYNVHSTAVDNSDGGFGCQAPPDMTVTYPLDASSDVDAGGSVKCTTSMDTSTCTTTTVCTSMSGSISSKLTNVTKINSDGKGYTITQTQLVMSGTDVSTDCTITSVATPM